MKVLVTGCNGFIGYWLCQRLLLANHDVIGCDNNTVITSVNYNESCRVQQLRKNHLKKLMTVHPCCFSEVHNYVDFSTLDAIIHLAAYAGVRDSFLKPERYYDNNVIKTGRLIKQCEKHGVPRVLYASSSSVTANNKIFPVVESEPVGYVASHYANTKICNENQFRLSKIPTTIGMRFFTVYGPYGRPDMALYNFVHSLYNQTPIRIFDNGNMSRDFTHIGDIVDGILLLLYAEHQDLPVVQQGKTHDIFNIGYGQFVPLKVFVDHIIENVQEDIPNVYDLVQYVDDVMQGDVQSTWSDTRKLKKLGYHPTMSIDKSVKNFVDWYRKERNNV